AFPKRQITKAPIGGGLRGSSLQLDDVAVRVVCICEVNPGRARFGRAPGVSGPATSSELVAFDSMKRILERVKIGQTVGALSPSNACRLPAVLACRIRRCLGVRRLGLRRRLGAD